MRKNLKEARQRVDMTQQQMADKLGINLRHYQKIEYGEFHLFMQISTRKDDRWCFGANRKD